MYNCVKRVLKNDSYSFFQNCTQIEAFRFTIRSRHTLCSVAATGIPNVVIPEYARGSFGENSDSTSNSISGINRTQLPSLLRFHDPRTNGPEYIPYAQKLIEGISALDEDRTWRLVHELVLKGHLSPSECPEFAEFEHVVRLGDFSLAFSALLWKERYSPSRDAQEIESLAEASADDHSKPPNRNRHISSLDIPTWLSAYMLSTMVRTRAAAVKSFDLCLMLLDTTSKPIAASLLLLSMCSLVRFNLMNHIPALLSAFSDILVPSLRSEVIDSTPVVSPKSPHHSRPLIVFQCNVLLNLLSQMQQSVTLGKITTRFLRKMQRARVSLETDTAKKLLDANFATQEMAGLITEMLQNQSGLLVGDDYSDLYVALARFYTKRRDLTKALEVVEETRNQHINKHLRTYLRAFRDTAYALMYVKDVRGAASSDESSTEQDKDVLNRPVYVSLLRSAAHCRSISTESFLNMFQVIRDQFDDDKRLYTVALIGLIRRHNFEQAKALWSEWVASVGRLEMIIRQLQRYLSERERKYEDAKEVRKALDWDEQTELQAKQKLEKLRIDSDALVLGIRAVSGPKPDSLVVAFSLMEEYARKETVLITSRVVNCFMNRAVSFRRPDIAFKLWDGMKAHYGVNPSLGSLVILMRASRVSASMSSSMRRFVPKWLRRRVTTIPLDASFDEGLRLMLHPTYIPDISWRDWEPWRVTRYIFREKIVYRSWPKLRKVSIPALAIRGDSATDAIDALLEAELHLRMKDIKFGPYYHLLPDQQTFKQYVLMLGRVQRSSEIPEVLAWMKELDVVPTKLTLSVFLALWSQIGLDSPVNEGWKMLPGCNAGHGGEYDKLIVWLENWVGKESVPTDGEVLEAFKYIDFIESKESVLY